MATIISNYKLQTDQTNYASLFKAVVFDVSLVATGVLACLAIRHVCALYYMAIPGIICVASLISLVKKKGWSQQNEKQRVVEASCEQKALSSSIKTLPIEKLSNLPTDFHVDQLVIKKYINRTLLGQYELESFTSINYEDLTSLTLAFHHAMLYFLLKYSQDETFKYTDEKHFSIEQLELNGTKYKGVLLIKFERFSVHYASIIHNPNPNCRPGFFQFLIGYLYTHFSDFVVNDMYERLGYDHGSVPAAERFLLILSHSPHVNKDIGFLGPYQCDQKEG